MSKDMDRMASLAGIKKSAINESVNASDKPYSLRAYGTKVLGTFRHGSKIYIKESVDGKVFDFIGGEWNKERYGYTRLSEAEKNMDFMAKTLIKEMKEGRYQMEDEDIDSDIDMGSDVALDGGSDTDADMGSDNDIDMGEPDGAEPLPDADEPADDMGDVDSPEATDVDVDVDVDSEDSEDMGDGELDSDSEGGESDSDEESPMVHAGRAQNNITSIDLSDESAENAIKQVVGALESKVEGSEMASVLADELEQAAKNLKDGVDEGYGMKMESKDNTKKPITERIAKRKALRESIRNMERGELDEKLTKYKIFENRKISKKMDRLKELKHKMALIKENQELKKGSK